MPVPDSCSAATKRPLEHCHPVGPVAAAVHAVARVRVGGRDARARQVAVDFIGGGGQCLVARVAGRRRARPPGVRLEYRSLYLASPLTILDIRDGGWSATFGLLGAWMFALYRERKAPAIKTPMRWALALGTAVFAIGIVALALQGSRGQKLPELAFTSLEGQTVQLKEFEGKPTVVNLWATWCPPCVREMPVLHAAQDKHQDVNFVFLNQGEEPGQVSRWLDSQRLPLRNVLPRPEAPSQCCVPTAGLSDDALLQRQGRARLRVASANCLPPRSTRDWKP